MTPARKLGYAWHLRLRMAEQSMFATTDLVPLLAERGVVLSAAQVYRLVTQTPERLSLRTLMVLCDILACSPNDLIEPVARGEPAGRHAALGVEDPERVASLHAAERACAVAAASASRTDFISSAFFSARGCISHAAPSITMLSTLSSGRPAANACRNAASENATARPICLA